MFDDPIVEEFRRIREADAARFNYDIYAMFRQMKEEERRSGQIYVTFPPRPVPPEFVETPQAAHPKG